MKNFFKFCDFYGTQFHWYFNFKPKYYTCYGGIFSILSVICCLIVFIIFGLEDFKRLNPISSISTVPPLVHKNIKFGEKKLYLPWRIMDYGERFIDHKGILFPRIYYFSNKYNNKTGIMETYYTLLNYTLCNETSMKNLGNDFLIDLPLDNLFCIDMEDLNMGGSWNSEFVNYIRLDLNLCKEGLDYNESNINCTRREYLNSLYGKDNNWFFELLYPSVQFQPNNKTMPVLVLYTSYYYGLSVSSNKVDRVFLQEHIFEDEKGWIIEKITNITYWGVSSIKSDYYTGGGRDIFRYGSTSRLYSLKIYLDYGTVYYTRKYKKLFEILSELLPILKGIIVIFSFLSEVINKLKVTKKLNEYIIGNEINLFKKNEKQKNIKFTYNLSGKKNNMNRKSVNRIKDSSKILCINNIDKIDNNENKPKKSKKKISIVEFLNIEHSNSLNVSIINSDIFEIFEKKKPNFPLSYYLFGFFLNKLHSTKNNNYLCLSEKFDLSFTYFTHLIDITSYISLYQQFESLKKMILTKENNQEYPEISKIERKYLNENNNLKLFNKILKANLTFEKA